MIIFRLYRHFVRYRKSVQCAFTLSHYGAFYILAGDELVVVSLFYTTSQNVCVSISITSDLNGFLRKSSDLEKIQKNLENGWNGWGHF